MMTVNRSPWPTTPIAGDGPLAGIRIVDLSLAGPGPFGTLILAAYGADIIHVGRADGGDAATDTSHQNCGKRSIRLDLKSLEGCAVVRDLARSADVLVEGFRPGVMERLGLGPNDLLRENPRLIYVRMTGWGQKGPYAQMAGHDINYLAIAGALAQIGRDEPTPPLALVGDYAGGALMMVINLMMALRDRDRDGGGGRVIDACITDGVAMLLHGILSAAPRGGGITTIDLLNGTAPFYRAYRCADGKWFSVGAIEPKFYRNLVHALALSEDARVARQYDVASWPVIAAIFAERFAERTREEWRATLTGAEACAFPVLEPHEIADDPHLAARGTAYREADRVHITLAGREPGAMATRLAPAPAPGGDTEAVLKAMGYDQATIAGWLERKLAAPADPPI